VNYNTDGTIIHEAAPGGGIFNIKPFKLTRYDHSSLGRIPMSHRFFNFSFVFIVVLMLSVFLMNKDVYFMQTMMRRKKCRLCYSNSISCQLKVSKRRCFNLYVLLF